MHAKPFCKPDKAKYAFLRKKRLCEKEEKNIA